MRGELELHIRTEEGGFTLIEILVAMVIFGLLAVVFSSVFVSSIGSIWGAGSHHAALVEAQILMERALGDTSLGEDKGIFREPLTLDGQKGILITVKLPWQAGIGNERLLELSTFRADPKE